MKSSTAAPSLRNSGLETTANSGNLRAFESTFFSRCLSTRRISAATLSAVPTGTVDLSTTTRKRDKCSPICSATASTWLVSALESPLGGVPTAMNRISAWRTPVFISVVKTRRPAAVFLAISSARPGSKIGTSADFRRSTRVASRSTQITWLPNSAKHAADTSPT